MTDQTITHVSEETKRVRRYEANVILSQLGGSKFIAMTGAKYFSFDESYPFGNIQFKFFGSKAATHCQIRANGKDLYDMKFMKVRGATCKVVAEKNDIYDTALQMIFTEVTGLDTSLGTLGRK